MKNVIAALTNLIGLEPDADPRMVALIKEELENIPDDGRTYVSSVELHSLVNSIVKLHNTERKCTCDLSPVVEKLTQMERNMQLQLATLGKGIANIDGDLEGLKDVIQRSDGDFATLVRQLQDAITKSRAVVSFEEDYTGTGEQERERRETVGLFQSSYLIGDAKFDQGIIRAGKSWTSGYRLLGTSLKRPGDYVEWKLGGKGIFGISAYPQAISNPPAPGEGWVNTNYGWYVRNSQSVRATNLKTHRLSDDVSWSPDDMLRIGFDENGKLYWEIENQRTVVRQEYVNKVIDKEYFFYGVFASSSSYLSDIKVVN